MNENVKSYSIKDSISETLTLVEWALSATSHIENGLNGPKPTSPKGDCDVCKENREPGVIEALEILKTRADEMNKRVSLIAEMF